MMTVMTMIEIMIITFIIVTMFKNSTHCTREYEVERVQLELLDLGQELLRLRCQVDLKEIFVIFIVIVIAIVVILTYGQHL